MAASFAPRSFVDPLPTCCYYTYVLRILGKPEMPGQLMDGSNSDRKAVLIKDYCPKGMLQAKTKQARSFGDNLA